MKFFHPDLLVDHVQDISVSWLLKQGIRLVFLDLDNTIVPYHTTHMEPDARKWIHSLKAAGIDVVVVSNNVKKRIDLCLQDPEFPETLVFACKPFGRGVFRAARKHGVKMDQCAFVGDQLFTDMLCARFHGAHAILNNPLDADARKTTGILRVMENALIKRVPRKGTSNE